MIKKILCLFCFVFLVENTIAQETAKKKIDIKKNPFEVSIAYGISDANTPLFSMSKYIDLGVDIVGTFFEVDFGIRLKKNRFIGISFGRRIHTGNIDNEVIYDNKGKTFGLRLKNYRTHLRQDLFGIYFRRVFKQHLNLTVGINYYTDYFNQFSTYIEPEDVFADYTLFLQFQGPVAGTNSLNLSFAVGYFFPIKEYFLIGMRMKVHYFFLEATTTPSFTPVIKFSF